MINKIIHSGSSSTGLLSAIAVFVGLLVYATYFAFNSQSKQIVTENLAKPDIEAGANIITPLSSGIFNTETLSVDKLIEPDQVKLKPGQAAAEIGATVAPIDDQSAHNRHNDHTPTYDATVQRVQPGHPLNDNHAQLSVNHNAENLAFFAQQHYYKKLGEGRSRASGRGRGHLDSTGEFNFNLKFKSRTRMDANIATERRLSKAINANNNAYYQQGYTANPAYHYTNLNY